MFFHMHFCFRISNLINFFSFATYCLLLNEYQARYYADEVKDKSGKDINFSSWKHECVEDLPVQKNG